MLSPNSFMVLEFFANLPYGDVILAALIIVASVIIAKIFIVVFSRTILHMTAKTKTKLDNLIVEAIKRPIYIAILLAGILGALYTLSSAAPYIDTIRMTFIVLWILLGAYTVSRVVKAFFRWYSAEVSVNTDTKMDETMAPIIRKIISAFIYVIAFMVILRSFGVEITPLVAGLGIGGLAIALALQESLANLFSGAFVISDKVIKSGDYIEIENGPKGYVQEIGWRSTKIKTLPNNIVVIPNSKLANTIVTDYDVPSQDLAVLVQVGVAYESDLEKVEKVSIEVGEEIQKTVEGAVRDFKPFIRYHTFSDSNINFTVILRGNKFVDQYLITHEFIKALKKRFDKEKIEISFPVRKIVNGK